MEIKSNIVIKAKSENNNTINRSEFSKGIWKNTFLPCIMASADGQILNVWTHKIYSPIVNSSGYKMVHIGKMLYTVHSLVAYAFLGEKPEGKEIDHIDGDKLNNFASNLQYISHSENMKKAVWKNKPAKYGVLCVTDGTKYCSPTEAAHYFGVTANAIRMACKGKIKVKGCTFEKI